MSTGLSLESQQQAEQVKYCTTPVGHVHITVYVCCGFVIELCEMTKYKCSKILRLSCLIVLSGNKMVIHV